jgi:hypothetical protein
MNIEELYGTLIFLNKKSSREFLLKTENIDIDDLSREEIKIFIPKYDDYIRYRINEYNLKSKEFKENKIHYDKEFKEIKDYYDFKVKEIN